MRSPLRLLVTAQLCLFIGLLICVLLIPHFLFEANEGGVSNYGTYAKTVLPYTLAFGICGVATIWAARNLGRDDTDSHLRPLLVVLGILYLFVLFSTYPYKLSAFYSNLHHIAGAALVIYSVALGSWLTLFKAHTTTVLALYTVQLIGFLLAVLTFLGAVHVLFVAELLGSTAFGALLIVTMSSSHLRVHATNRHSIATRQ